jgi:hypothetical protein
MVEVTAPVMPEAETPIKRTDKGVVFCIDRSGSLTITVAGQTFHPAQVKFLDVE